MANTTAHSTGRQTKAEASRISGVDPWRTLEALSFYRAAACIALLALASSAYRPPYFQGTNAPLIDAALFVGLFVCALFLVFVRGEWPHWRWQAGLQIGTDIAFLIFLNYASGGISSGIATLLVTPVAAGSLLLDRRLAALPAALATIALLLVELYLNFQGPAEQKLSQAGMLGAGLFIIALSGSALARRARESETKAHQAMSDLAKLAALSESVIHKLQAGVIVCNHDGEIELMNRASKHFLGSLAIRTSNLERHAPELWNRLQQWRIEPTAQARSAIDFEGSNQAWAQFTRLGSGARASTLIVLDDASRIAEQAQALKLASLGQLSASIAHELRNPLAAIQNAAELASESHDLSDEADQLISIIQRQSRRINNIIESVLNLSRKSMDPPTTIDLRNTIQEALDEFPPCAAGIHLRPRISTPKHPVKVCAHPEQIKQIIFKLLENTLSHAKKPSVAVDIALSISRDHLEACLDFKDDGPGIPSEIANRIFEPFFSTDHSGTGLGLYIAREFSTANAGNLKVIPNANGAWFRLSLPIMRQSSQP